jgi:hypothetical protein
VTGNQIQTNPRGVALMPKFGHVSLVLLVGLVTPVIRAEDKVNGAIWHVKNKEGAEWDFRAGEKGVLWTVPKEGKPEKLGSWTGDGDKTVMEIDAPALGKIGKKRTITIIQIEKKPLKYQGEVEFPDGKKIPLTVTLVKD